MKYSIVAAGLAGLALTTSPVAMAQESDLLCTGAEPSDLLGMNNRSLMSELNRRYDLSATTAASSDVINSNSTVYTWATEAAAYCAIAIGYLRSGEQDEFYVNRCDCFSNRLVPIEPPAPPPPPEYCEEDLMVTVYFGFDRHDLNDQSRSALRMAAAEAEECGLRQAIIEGHTDRSGSNAYNDALAERRASTVTNFLIANGFSSGQVTTRAFGENRPAQPTEDGVREPLNRRVEAQIIFVREDNS